MEKLMRDYVRTLAAFARLAIFLIRTLLTAARNAANSIADEDNKREEEHGE